LIRIRRALFSRSLLRLGLRLLRGLGSLAPFALAALEAVIGFAWYFGYSGSRASG
jgi:hypothetical protein